MLGTIRMAGLAESMTLETYVQLMDQKEMDGTEIGELSNNNLSSIPLWELHLMLLTRAVR